MQNPQEGWSPAGWKSSAIQSKQCAAHDYTLNGTLGTWHRWALLNADVCEHLHRRLADLTGVPHFSADAKVGAIATAGMVGIASIDNAVGRIFRAWISVAATR